MTGTVSRAHAADHLSRRDFERLARFIHEYSGIKISPVKQTMVEGRLRRRIRALGLNGLADYCRHVFDEGGMTEEALHLIDAVTTNKTEFFREPEHFRFLAEQAVPRLIAEQGIGIDRPLKVWSAASSIGAEPYTIAMVLADCALSGRGLRFIILATDICTEVLDRAVTAIYPEQMIAPVPPDMRRRYVLRAKDRKRGVVRMAPELRRMVRFGRINLVEENYPVDKDMHVIFCRNILIYFDKPTQQAVLSRLCGHLRPGGYLFLGHSETLAGFHLPLVPVATTVFRRI